MGIPVQTLQDFFNLSDTDKDGKINLAEYKGSPVRLLLLGLTGGAIGTRFYENNTISFEDLKQLFKDAGNLDE